MDPAEVEVREVVVARTTEYAALCLTFFLTNCQKIFCIIFTFSFFLNPGKTIVLFACNLYKQLVSKLLVSKYL